MMPYKLTAILEERGKKGFGQPGIRPELVEMMAEEKFREMTKGSYNKRNKKCPSCFTLKSVTGVCINCD